MSEKTVIKHFGLDFDSAGGALTLEPGYIGTHENGWTITGQIHEDYYEWVNEFEAVHPELGKVWGNFEGEVLADSEEAFQAFYTSFPPVAWDYMDI